MDLAPLQIPLRTALSQGVGPAPPPPRIRKDSVFFTHCQATNASVSPRSLKTILDAFAPLGLTDILQRVRVEVPDGLSYEINAAFVAYWLIARAFSSTPEIAIQEFDNFLEQKPRRFWSCVGLAGIEVIGKIDMGNGVFLCDLASAPASSQLESWSGKPPEEGAMSSAHYYMTVEAVLVVKKEAPVRLHHGPPAFPDFPLLSSGPKMGKIAQCLPLFGPNAATAFANWEQMDETWSIPGYDAKPRGVTSMNELRTTRSLPFVDEPRREEIISSYLALSESRQTALSIGLSRFALAMRRQRIEDRAIELRVALEALLTPDRKHDTPVTHLIRQRGGLALGTTVEERKAFGSALAKAYGCGSTAIHTGLLKLEKDKTYVEAGMQHCAELLKRFILVGPPKDWDELIFSARSPY